MKITTNFIKQTKRHLCASGSILLPLAQKWGLVGLVVMVMLSAFGTQSVSAASITLTVPKEPLMFNITPSSGGTFGKSAAGTIKIQTDALAGYTLNIKAKDGKADLTNEATGNKISPISSDVSENDFMSKAAYNNMWGFSFDKQGVSSNTFRSIPDDAVGTKIGSTEVPNTAEDIYNIVLGARVDNSLATGTYSNTFIVVASANPVPYKVKYDPNAGSDSVSGMPSNSISATTSTQSFALPAEEPTRSGYRFIGWCDTMPNKESDTVDVCQNGKSYQSSDTYTLSKRDEAVTLYAMWVDNDHIMQNWTGCKSQNKNEQITLVDIRDNRPYYVAQLADGNCWMTENLDLFIDANKTYTVADTDLDHATEEEKGDSKDADGYYQWKPEKPEYATKKQNDTTWRGTKGIYGTEDEENGENIPQSYDGGDYCWDVKSYESSGTNNYIQCNQHDESHHHVGNYYDFTAAIAQNDTASIPGSNYVKSNTSICPVGWQLPEWNGDKSLYNLTVLDETMTFGGLGETVHKAPYYFLYSRYWNGHYAYNVQVYWTNTATKAIQAYHSVWHSNGSVNLRGDFGYRLNGFSIRCVSRQ